jgi:ankyrin repeat protein
MPSLLVYRINYCRFRWVACQLDFICDLTSDDEYCQALDGLAPTLFEIYERLLIRVQSRPKSTQDLVKFALMWILFSTDRLTNKELCEAVTIRTGSVKKPVPMALNQIRKFCSSLIREAEYGGRHRLEVAHFTVTEFFNSITEESHPHIAQFCFSEEKVTLEFSKVCLTYLNFNDFHKPIPPFDSLFDALECHHFYWHATWYWFIYAQDHWTDVDVLQLAKQLFNPQMSTNFKLWRNFVLFRNRHASDLMERINTLGDTPLHWAAYLCIPELLEWLLSCGKGTDIDFAAALGTPLLAAIFGRRRYHTSLFIIAPPYSVHDIARLENSFEKERERICVEMLIKRGARTDYLIEYKVNREIDKLSLREVLLFSQNFQIFEMEFFQVEFFDEHTAARMKRIIYSMLDDDGDCYELGDMARVFRKMKKTFIVPEFHSAFNSFVKELEDGIESDEEIMEKVWTAARNDQADVLESLLKERGVQINKGYYSCLDDDDDYYDGMNALHEAAKASSVECIQVLMDAEADAHQITRNGITALHFAAGSPNFKARQCVKMLANAGISLDQKTDDHRTVLHFAAFSGHLKTAEFLLEKYFGPYAAHGSGHTIHNLTTSNSLDDDVCNPLLKNNTGGISGLQVLDPEGFTPPQIAVLKDNTGFIRELLKHIDMKELATEKETFIFFVARKGSTKMMEVFLDSDPDIFVRGNDQSTILHAMAENDANFKQHIMDVVNKGVVVSEARDDGSLPLHILLSGPQPVSEGLLKAIFDGDPNAVNETGNNYLMCLFSSYRSLSQKIHITVNLLKLGVHAFQKNNK